MRRRTLRRRPRFRLARVEDLNFLYAAYKQGAFDFSRLEAQIGEAIGQLSLEQFAALLDRIAGAGVELYIGIARNAAAPNHGAEIPVCLCGITRPDHPRHGVANVRWLPWATARNKVETTVNFLNEMRRDMVLEIVAQQADWKFYEHMARYGLLRPVGTFFERFEDGSPARIWQTR